MNAKPLTRRNFLKQSGLVTAAFTVAPYVIGSDKTGQRPPIVGTGEHQ